MNPGHSPVQNRFYSMKMERFLIFFAGALLLILVSNNYPLCATELKTKVKVIIDRLPIEEQDKMRDFHIAIKNYMDNVQWIEQTDGDMAPIEVSVQMFLTEIPSSVEDRYKCEFLISSSDVQYFDKRVRFPYSKDDLLVYNEQSVEPLTGLINFYVNMVLGSELDKYGENRGDFYYKRAQNFAALGKFVRTEYVFGWIQRGELIQRVFVDPFPTFRKMKDYYYYGLYILEESIEDARKNLTIALDMLAQVLDKNAELEEPKQFLDVHYLEFIDIFKDDKTKSEIFKKLKLLDPQHSELYDKHIEDSLIGN